MCIRDRGNNEQYKLGFMGDVNAGKPIKILFRTRLESENKDWEKKRDEARRDAGPSPLPILTKPPKTGG